MGFRYYSTLRPIAPGTFPKPNGNGVLVVHNFDNRQFVESIGRQACGYVEYEKPLEQNVATQFELVEEHSKPNKSYIVLGKTIRGVVTLASFDSDSDRQEWLKENCNQLDSGNWKIKYSALSSLGVSLTAWMVKLADV